MAARSIHLQKSECSEPASGWLEVRNSPVHGRGVFARCLIQKEVQIIEYTGRRIAWKDVPADSDDPRTYFFGILDGSIVIDPKVGGNQAQWINHSCDPNCEAIEQEDGRVFIHALRDISPGEELFYDYQLEVDEPRTAEAEEESRCFCGAANCRGTMLERAAP
jgi:SET domain-containing protein